jgi:glyoxylase-like metal-dependent hydrolase (beta-lactamase superfamily II)
MNWLLKRESRYIMLSFFKNGCAIHQIEIPTPYVVGAVNIYILEQMNGLTLIDAGINTDECWEILQRSLAELGFTIDHLERILITHHHPDHIGLLNRILTYREVPVFAHPYAIPTLVRDREFLLFRIGFFQKMYREMGCGVLGEQYIEQLKTSLEDNAHQKIRREIITPLVEAQIILGMEVIETPGHAPDQLVFLDRKRDILFAGDHLLPNTSSNAIVEPDINGRRLATVDLYRQSLIKCLELQTELIFPGHGQVFEDHLTLINTRLSRMDVKANRIKLLAKGKAKTAFGIAREMYPEEYKREFWFVMSEVMGFLDYLELNDHIEKQLKNDVWYYCAKAQ